MAFDTEDIAPLIAPVALLRAEPTAPVTLLTTPVIAPVAFLTKSVVALIPAVAPAITSPAI